MKFMAVAFNDDYGTTLADTRNEYRQVDIAKHRCVLTFLKMGQKNLLAVWAFQGHRDEHSVHRTFTRGALPLRSSTVMSPARRSSSKARHLLARLTPCHPGQYRRPVLGRFGPVTESGPFKRPYHSARRLHRGMAVLRPTSVRDDRQLHKHERPNPDGTDQSSSDA
jgi:hypothetical protein